MVKPRKQVKIHSSFKDKEIKRLRKLNQELESFKEIVSHDLSSPLGEIMLQTDLLMADCKDHLDEKTLAYIKDIGDSTNRMLHLIHDLIEMTKVDRVQNPYEMVDTHKQINELLQFFKLQIKEKGAHVFVQSNLPTIYCNRTKMSLIFTNLIGNALKFNSNTGRVPEISIGYADREEAHEFTVEDNGIGIEEEYRDRLFELFYQLKTDAQNKGSGVGLYLVKKIVEEHGGKVWINSKINEGAQIHFTIQKSLKSVPVNLN